MLDPTALFQWEPHIDQRTLRADTLVVTLGSYVDAGHSQRLVDSQLMEHLPNRVLGRFDTDQVIDYAGRRPTIHFDRDHFAAYDKPEITLHLLTDRDGRDFLLLNGPEPSLQWERMAEGVRHVIDQLDVQRTYLVQSMPAPAPHTRPVAVTRFASDPELVADEAPVLGTFQLSASFPGLLTLRLGEAGHDVLGLVAHVPHYIADNDYPDAAAALLTTLREIATLAVPVDGLDLAAGIMRAQIDTQVSESEELGEMVGALERGYDHFVSERQVRNAENASLPSADEIGEQFEQFLADLGTDEPDADQLP
ncbi:MAG: PAC2 family protein [Propionibacteriaceae bacterium]|nr:PAC2 family protein [Propionibacteriaceae bacterium]